MTYGYQDRKDGILCPAWQHITTSFSAFSRSLGSEIEKINRQEEHGSFLGVSYASIERYGMADSYLNMRYRELTDMKILDFWCFVGLYVKYLHSIGVWNAFWMDISEKSIQYGKDILWIPCLSVGDIASIPCDGFSAGTFDVVLCIHTFEYMVIQRNGPDFIGKVLENAFYLLRKGGIFLFNIGEWYKKFDPETETYVHFEGKVEFRKEDCRNLWFSEVEELKWKYFILTK